MQFLTVIYIGGCFGQAFSNGSLAALYVTRIISGVGIGATTVLPSIYITEVIIDFPLFPLLVSLNHALTNFMQ